MWAFGSCAPLPSFVRSSRYNLSPFSSLQRYVILWSLNDVFVLFSVNYLLIEALQRYDYFFGDKLMIECPTRSGNRMRLRDVALELSRRVVSLFLPDENGRRPCHGDDERYANDPHWSDLVLFYEYFHPETGRGCGAR